MACSVCGRKGPPCPLGLAYLSADTGKCIFSVAQPLWMAVIRGEEQAGAMGATPP